MTAPDRKSVLCIVPLPFPVTGASLVSQDIVDRLRQSHDVSVIPYQRGNLNSGTFSASQVLRIISCTLKLLSLRLFRRFDAVYLVVSSSFWGNARDILFLTTMGRGLREKLTIHLHGANFDTIMVKASGLRRKLNRDLLKDVRTALVLGEFFWGIFDGYVPRERIRLAKNYYDPSLLIPEEKMRAKFEVNEAVNILYLSNLMREKGYESLLNAFLSLPSEVSRKANLHFAGNISAEDKESFLNRIRDKSNIFYHGAVGIDAKRDLLWKSQVFCLPTLYRFEGQPLSILEAYASGCCVLTTHNGGITDIFKDGKNGIALDDNLKIDADKMSKILADAILNVKRYQGTASYNRSEAEKTYCKIRYMESVEKIILGDRST